MIYLLIALILFALSSAVIVFLFGVLLPNLEQRGVSVENPLLFSRVSYVGEPAISSDEFGSKDVEYIPALDAAPKCRMVQTIEANADCRHTICAQFASCIHECPRVSIKIVHASEDSTVTIQPAVADVPCPYAVDTPAAKHTDNGFISTIKGWFV